MAVGGSAPAAAFREYKLPRFEFLVSNAFIQYAVEGLDYSYNNPSRPDLNVSTTGYTGHTSVNPQEHHNSYYNEPYQPTPNDETYPLNTYEPAYNDRDPILHSQTPASGYEEQEPDYPSHTPTPVNPPIRRWKTVKTVKLYKGNLVLDCPVPKKLLQLLPLNAEREFTHMRSALSADLPFFC